jgi:hypothetical protein
LGKILEAKLKSFFVLLWRVKQNKNTMNSNNVIEYIKFAYWALKQKQSAEECFKLGDSPEAISEHVKNIINDTSLDAELQVLLPIQKTKPPIKKAVINEHIQKNMEIYETSEKEAREYESHCHKCGSDICIGQKYCCQGCLKIVEDFNYYCYWGKSCKMCHVREEYIVVTRNFELSGKTYWIDDEKNVYNDEHVKVATEREGNIIYNT